VASSLTRCEPPSAHSRLALASGHPAGVSCYANTPPARTPHPTPLWLSEKPHQTQDAKKQDQAASPSVWTQSGRLTMCALLLVRVRQDFRAHLNATRTHCARVWAAGTNTSRRSRDWCGRSCWRVDQGCVGRVDLGRAGLTKLYRPKQRSIGNARAAKPRSPQLSSRGLDDARGQVLAGFAERVLDDRVRRGVFRALDDIARRVSRGADHG
jgi:hypothetical protein